MKLGMFWATLVTLSSNHNVQQLFTYAKPEAASAVLSC
jgi:hypothetical protein